MYYQAADFLGEEAHQVPNKRRYLAQLHGHSN